MREDAVVALLNYDLKRFALLFGRQFVLAFIAAVLVLISRPQRSSLLVLPALLVVGSLGGLPALASADKREEVSLWLSRLPFSRSERSLSRTLSLAIAWFGSLLLAVLLILLVGSPVPPAVLVYAVGFTGLLLFPCIVFSHAMLSNVHVLFGIALTAIVAVGVLKLYEWLRRFDLQVLADAVPNSFIPREPLILLLVLVVWLALLGFSYWLLGVCLKPRRPFPI